MNPKVNMNDTTNITIPYSTKLRYQSTLAWNKDVFISKDPVKCPITNCQLYLPGCNTPITGITNMMFMENNGLF